jgi:hypothetical protein
MNSEEWTLTFRDIINDARNALAHARRRTTNLYLETVPYMKGSVIGPEFQKIRARQRSILVFADDDPMANFGHPCRYRFYDERTHAFLYEVAAEFPPYLQSLPQTYKVFHEPVRPLRSTVRTPLEITPPTQAPGPAPAPRERYAILFSGSSDRRHLNDLEYCYRMLTERYGFNPANICVLNRDNTRKIRDGSVAMNWPEESGPIDAYKIAVPPFPASLQPPPPLPRFPANRNGFKLACQLIGPKLQPQDLVFIHTNGHGGALLMGGQLQDPWLVGHDNQPFTVHQFCEELAALKQHESLLIVMQQCYSGQFIGPVVDAKGSASDQIKAKRLSIACASLDPSYSNEECTFNRFMFGWITAHLDKDPYGDPPGDVVDTDDVLGIIEAKEAYAYAENINVAHPFDHPECANAPAIASVALGITIPPAGDIQLT